MRKPLHTSIALTALGIGVCAFAACTSFSGASDTTNDAGPEAATNADALVPGPDGGDAATTFCGSQKAALFCDDFEQPGRTLDPGSPAPWTDYKFVGPAPVLGMGFHQSRGLHIKGVFDAPANTLLSTDMMIAGGPRTRARFMMRVDKVADATDAGQEGSAFLASFRFAGVEHISWGFKRGANQTLDGFVLTSIDPPVNQQFDIPATPPPFAQWVSIALEWEPSGTDADATFRITANGKTLHELKHTTPPGIAALTLGAEVFASGVNVLDIDVSFDEVVIENY